MSEPGRPIETLTDVRTLSLSQLRARFEALCADCANTTSKNAIKLLFHELKLYQSGLEKQNRELHEVQRQLKETRDRYADLYDFAPVCYITFNSRGEIEDINLTGAAMLNRDREQLIDTPFSIWLAKADRAKFFDHLHQALCGHNATSEELQLQLDGGQVRDVILESIAANHVRVDEPVCRCIIINVTKRKLAEREIQRQARQLRLVTDAMPALIAYVDSDERYQFVNKFYGDWYRLPAERIIGRTVREVIGEDAYRVLEKFIRRTLEGQPVGFELSFPYHSGLGAREIKANYIPDFSADGEVVGYFALIRDVTEEKQRDAMERMRLLETAHIARLNTMGGMVAEIAHELNQPLAAITIYSDIVSRMLGKLGMDHHDLLTAMSEIKQQAERASTVIIRLREFVSKKELQPLRTDINALVEEVLHLVSVEATWNHVDIRLELDETIPSVYVDKILIEQVIFNLTRNAIEAMAMLGEERRTLSIRTSFQENNEIELDVTDSGPGLGEEQIEQAFEPFYSSKQNGMGMGLAICRSIIKAHHGQLWATPNQYGGTTFTFKLPAVNYERKEHGGITT